MFHEIIAINLHAIPNSSIFKAEMCIDLMTYMSGFWCIAANWLSSLQDNNVNNEYLLSHEWCSSIYIDMLYSGSL